jgi:hypothetical protein
VCSVSCMRVGVCSRTSAQLIYRHHTPHGVESEASVKCLSFVTFAPCEYQEGSVAYLSSACYLSMNATSARHVRISSSR